MSDSRHHGEAAAILTALERSHPDARAFRGLSAPVWRLGAISIKDKHLLAVAVAQITRCAYCIEHHAILAKHEGASRQEALAASYLSAPLSAFGTAVISIDQGHLLCTDDESAVDAKPIADARLAFARKVFANETLPLTLRWTIGAATAYAQDNEARRITFHQEALAAGASSNALDEAYAIVVALRAGAIYAHTLAIADAFGDDAA
jgi:AhpD family alkylhydroperoxidase